MAINPSPFPESLTMRVIMLCLLLTIIIYGCGSENEDIKPVKLIEVVPKNNTELFQNGFVMLKFSPKPDMVVVNDVVMPEAEYHYDYENKIDAYYVYFTLDDRFISEPITVPISVTLTVTWADDAEIKSSTRLNYKVYKNYSYQKLISSDPGDKATDVDSTRINKEGIRFLFNEAVYAEKLIVHVTADNKELQWKVFWDPADQDTLILYSQPGNELGFGQEVVVQLENVMDRAGNLYEPDGKLELHFTTASK
jgi:hypothetical protein